MNVEEFIADATKKPNLKDRLQACKSVDDFIAFAREQGQSFDASEVKAALAAASPDVSGQGIDPLTGGEPGGEAFTRRG